MASYRFTVRCVFVHLKRVARQLERAVALRLLFRRHQPILQRRDRRHRLERRARVVGLAHRLVVQRLVAVGEQALLGVGRQVARHLVGIEAGLRHHRQHAPGVDVQHDRARRRAPGAARARRSAARRRPGSARRCCRARPACVVGPFDDVADVGLGQPAPIDDDLVEAGVAAQVAVPLPLDPGAADRDRRRGSPRPSSARSSSAEISFMKPSTCAASVAVRVRPARHRDDLDARQIDAGLDRRHRLARDVLGEQHGRRRARVAPAPLAIRSHTSIAWSPFMPSSGAQPREHLGLSAARGVHVDVVRGPHRRQHACPCGRGSARAPPAASRCG